MTVLLRDLKHVDMAFLSRTEGDGAYVMRNLFGFVSKDRGGCVVQAGTYGSILISVNDSTLFILVKPIAGVPC